MSLTAEQAAERAEHRAQEQTITKITEYEGSWDINLGSSGFMLRPEQLGDEDPPKVGDAFVLYTRGFSTIQGMDLRGKPLYYKTKAEMDEDHLKWVAESKERKRAEFEEKRDELDEQFEALPAVFQRRIQWFRDHCADFRWEYEGYELSSCTDAVRIADALKTTKAVERYGKASNKKQKELVPDVEYHKHSGNSFGMACRLAWNYLAEPLLVVAEHGAMTPLVGCEDYGCQHPREQDVLDAVTAFDAAQSKKEEG
jgi:hypothetical protein